MKWNTLCLILLAFILGFITHDWVALIEERDPEITEVTVIDLDVAEGSYERAWVAALGKYLQGETEVVLPLGRADVVTDEWAIEVDRPHKWKEGLGQALYYGRATGRVPVVAFMGPVSDEVIEVLQAEGVEVWVLE